MRALQHLLPEYPKLRLNVFGTGPLKDKVQTLILSRGSGTTYPCMSRRPYSVDGRNSKSRHFCTSEFTRSQSSFSNGSHGTKKTRRDL